MMDIVQINSEKHWYHTKILIYEIFVKRLFSSGKHYDNLQGVPKGSTVSAVVPKIGLNQRRTRALSKPTDKLHFCYRWLTTLLFH